MAPDAELQKLYDKAKIGLMRKPDSMFFTTVLFSLKFKWDATQPTAYTNGTIIGFNPDFFKSMAPDERIGVLVHEACHVAYLHMDRLNGRDMQVWNMAADHVINLELEARGFKLPSFRLADPRFTGMSAEQVYQILMDEKKQGQPPPPNMMQDLKDPEQGSKELQKQVQDILVRARIQSKMANDKPGAIPADIELMLDKLLNPILPWQALLRRFIHALNRQGYDWQRPNKRYFPEHYLPAVRGKNALVNFQAWVDISGSETDEDFQRFISELAGILRMMRPKQIELGQFDTCIKSISKVGSVADLAKVKFHGRGGTCITQVLDHIEKTRPELAMIFTDGGFRMDRKECKTNILWVIHDNPKWTAPFGKVIHYKTRGEA